MITFLFEFWSKPESWRHSVWAQSFKFPFQTLDFNNTEFFLCFYINLRISISLSICLKWNHHPCQLLPWPNHSWTPKLDSHLWFGLMKWTSQKEHTGFLLLQTMMVRDQDNEFQELRTSHMNSKLNATVIFLSLHPLQNKEALDLELQFERHLPRPSIKNLNPKCFTCQCFLVPWGN